MPGRCRTCKHWLRTNLTGTDRGWCLLTYFADGEPKHPESLAFAMASAMFAAAQLQTREEFGCVQWEAKEN